MLAFIKEHLEMIPGVCGGKPKIAGHRIRVMDIVVCHEHQGMPPGEIASYYPDITLADIHAALAYYFDHREEIQRDIEDERRFVEEVRQNTPSLLQEKLQRRNRSQ